MRGRPPAPGRIRDKALAEAIELGGGVTAVAKAIGITPSSLSGWQICPAPRVLALEAACEGKVKRWQLRPDIYPEPGAPEAHP